MSIKKRLIIIFLPLAAVFVLFLTAPQLVSNGHKTWLQVFIYPFVLLALSQVFVGTLRPPGAIFAAAALFASIGAGYLYLDPFHGKRGTLTIARFAADELENETRIFREDLNGILRHNSNWRAVNISNIFENYEEAEAFILKKPAASVLISGNEKWLNIFFAERAPARLEDLGLGAPFAKVKNLKVHYNVRAIGLSFNHDPQTVVFAANLAQGVLGYFESTANNGFELSLKNAVIQQSFWTSFAHRAFPLWFLGNHYLESSIAHNEFSRPLLSCAIKSYRKSLKYLRPGDNPDLQASIFNNLALAYSVRAYQIGKKKDLRTAKILLQSALKSYRVKTKVPFNYSAALLAQENLGYIEQGRVNFKASRKASAKARAARLKKNKKKADGTKKKRSGAPRLKKPRKK